MKAIRKFLGASLVALLLHSIAVAGSRFPLPSVIQSGDLPVVTNSMPSGVLGMQAGLEPSVPGHQQLKRAHTIDVWSAEWWAGMVFNGLAATLLLLYPVWVWRLGNWFFRAGLIAFPIVWYLGYENWFAFCRLVCVVPAVAYIFRFFIPVVHVVDWNRK